MANNLTTEEFITKARAVHGTYYDYSRVDYLNNHTDVLIGCPVHGDFWQIPANHLQGQNCPKCAIENIKEKQRTPIDEWIKKARKVHGNKYDYSQVDFVGIKKPKKII